ncbi:MAG TPA: hypothetical protein DDZ41_01460, partial [Flavobacterium sp.]|nr:hypothetical protein [Flavobacterium sp.]
QNYKIKIQLRDGSGTTIAGAYPAQEINITPADAISFTTPTLTTAKAGTTVQVGYKYTASASGSVYCAIELQNGWTWVGNVVNATLN